MNNNKIINEIKKLKEKKNAIILAHNYQIPEIQQIADIVGDSLKLSQEAAKAKEEIIILSGVHFMAESAKILAPDKKILLPVKDAGCPMAEMVEVEQLKAFKKNNPNIPIVCYVNTSAEVKAECDICCTSSNAVNIIKNIPSDKILFVPDQNLGQYIAKQVPEKQIILWEGYCIVHHRVKATETKMIRECYPEAKFLIHPECQPEIQDEADFIGSTSQIINYANSSQADTFVIGTEIGVLHMLQEQNPDKRFFSLSPGLICANMKKTTLEDIRNALVNEENEITLSKELRVKAHDALKRMLELS
ncbi:quinolinate synthase NadA [Serpentinicella sp. ANB-PHB4]|uniref:quinolinate synthase NadA n=1 Tax=Serpentinicella sp. ANB-PHB4 TaxID=3074076 RepID=UPI0028556C31|nr:quinolinate synthase NadA [Serpentinicella sp. ANB-PHB4]MDR5659499.1 quinolinate synthase NadA [Serpentinicella sp. ANB-PHB4]